jgi:alkaline phosphatase D
MLKNTFFLALISNTLYGKHAIFVFFFLINLNVLKSQSITAKNEPFIQGKPMEFTYSGGTGSSTDWIGIYQKGQTPGTVASTLWKYISSPSGTITFDGTLPAGAYDIHFFCCDGYRILASIRNFSISGPILKSRLSLYKTSDSLIFFSSNIVKNDKLAIYNSKDFVNEKLVSGAISIAEKSFSEALPATKVSFSPQLLPVGKYVGVLLSDSLKIKGFDTLEIKKAPVLPALITRIGLGSCSSQKAAQTVLNHIVKQNINAFVYIGDNLYIDTYKAEDFQTAYEFWITNRLEFQNLRTTVPLLATWDDHDYGCCDEDKDYPLKKEAQKFFLDFFEEPLTSKRRTQEGIYTQYAIGPAGKKFQIIVLDTRYFLDNKRPNNGCGKNDYCAWAGPSDVDKTMLGTNQWQWLKNTLSEPADLRMIVSSVQFSSSYHGFEGWSLFPYERKRMLELIKETKAENVFFVSGDMHYSEVSKLENEPDLYPIYDFTASGINQTWPPEPNTNRVENKAYGQQNVGLLDIDWDNKKIKFSAIDALNRVQFAHTVAFDELKFKKTTVIYEPENDIQFQQAPNPGQNGARLVFNKSVNGSLLLFDRLGRLYRQISVQGVDNVEMTGIPAGIYLAQLRTTNGLVLSTKVSVW